MKVIKISKINYKKAVPVYDLSVEHTQNFCLSSGIVIHNSKDRSDALAGVVFGLTSRAEIWIRHGINFTNIPQYLRATKRKTDMKSIEDVV